MRDQIDVFISYKREERALTRALLRALHKAGYTAITDLNIAKSTEFGDAIDQMIRSARLTVTLWTKASAASDWVRKESRLARDLEQAGKGNRYLGVLVEDVNLELPLDLRGLQMLPLSDQGLPEGLPRLMEEISAILGQTTATEDEARDTSADLDRELTLIETARSLDTPDAWQLYLTSFPQGAFAETARRELPRSRQHWRRPFRKGNVGVTVGWLGVAGTALGLVLTYQASTQDPVVIGIPAAQHQQTQTALTTAESQLTARATEVTRLETELADAKASADQALAEASAAAERATADLRTTHAQDLTEARTRAEAAEAKVTRLQTELAAAKSLATEQEKARALAEEQLASARAPQEDYSCQTDAGEDGIFFIECLPLTTTSLGVYPDSWRGRDFATETNIFVADPSSVSDLSPLRDLTSLSRLFLQGISVSDLSPLRDLMSLSQLELSNTSVYDLSPLRGLTSLFDLYLGGTSVSRLSPLRDLPSLSILRTPDWRLHTGREDVRAAIEAGSPP